MSQSQGTNGSPWSEWMESAVDMWMNSVKNWSTLPGFMRPEEYMKTSFEMLKAFVPSGASDQTGQTPFDMVQAFMSMLIPVGAGQEAFEWLWSKGEDTGQRFERVQKEAISAWTGIYESAFQPLLKIPQVGLTRVYQEKLNRLAEKFQSYQAAFSEFQMKLSGPMEKSFAEIKEEIEKLKKAGKQADDFKMYYGTWIGVLEKQYMSLFRSDEYRAALSSLIAETAAFRITGNDVLEELLEFLPIPTNKEMDELYKELYTLKKQNRETMKKISKLESTMTKKDA